MLVETDDDYSAHVTRAGLKHPLSSDDVGSNKKSSLAKVSL